MRTRRVRARRSFGRRSSVLCGLWMSHSLPLSPVRVFHWLLHSFPHILSSCALPDINTRHLCTAETGPRPLFLSRHNQTQSTTGDFFQFQIDLVYFSITKINKTYRITKAAILDSIFSVLKCFVFCCCFHIFNLIISFVSSTF